MATSDGVASAAVLDVLAGCGVRFALLHDEARIAAGSSRSDLDLVVDRDPRRILADHVPDLHRAGLYPIIVWPYDVAETATVFLARPDASSGVQLDLLCDPSGLGKYGVRSRVLLEQTGQGERWPVIRPEHQLLYLLRKRSHKGARDEVVELRRSLGDMQRTEILAEVGRLFSPPAAATVLRILDSGWDANGGHEGPPSSVRQGMRWLRRLRSPIGFWAELVGRDSSASAEELATRFGRFLPWSRAGGRPHAAPEALWWYRDVMPIRWRAGLFVSWSPVGGRVPRPDVAVRAVGRSLDEIGERVVAAMEERLRL
jgi:hypothetical protein